MAEYKIATKDEEYSAAAVLFREYAEAINIDLSFQAFEDELNNLREMYSFPEGGIILCLEDEQFIGCVAVRRKSPDIAELKRMYVKPVFQNKGIGKDLLEYALKLALDCGYKFIRLDTLNYMHPAIHLYKRYGFYEIPPYYHNPNNTAVFFEKNLTP